MKEILEIIKDNCKAEMRNHKENAADEIEVYIKENYIDKGFAKWLANELDYDFEGAYEVWKEHNIKDK